MKKDQIRKVIDVIYDEVFNQGQADLYAGLYEALNQPGKRDVDALLAKPIPKQTVHD